MNFLYNFGIKAYRAAVKLASLRNKKAKLMYDGQNETLRTIASRLNPELRYIWIHVASLGEFEQGRTLMERIKRDNPNAHIVLSFFSPSGYEVRKNYELADLVCYLPFDTPRNVKKFLDAVNPSMAIFVKYEFWGNYLHALKRRQVPTFIISAIFRPGQIFFRPWGGMFRGMLKCFTRLYVQNEESAQLLSQIGVTNVEVTGDTRFDRVAQVRAAAKEFPIIAEMVKDQKFTLVMGSSWQPDEDIAIPFFNAHPEMKLIIAPHEFNQARLEALMAKTHRKVALYTKTTPEEAASLDCLIIDCFGILSSLYRYGQVAYVGGGFGTGIHNINEAAVYGIPVLFGPKYGKFAEAHDLIANGGAKCVTCPDDFDRYMSRFLTSHEFLATTGSIAGGYIKSHIGSTDRIYASIFGQREQ